MPRGQKECPVCKTTCGPRTKTCASCGGVFSTGVKKEKTTEKGPRTVQDKLEVTKVAPGEAGFIFAASGNCPVKYRGNIKEWAREMKGYRKILFGEYYKFSNEAIIRFALDLPKEARHELLSIL
jgi:hypothetical protein